MRIIGCALTGRLFLLFLLLVWGFAPPVVFAEDIQKRLTPPAGLTAEEALSTGEAMYRRGMLPSGQPMTGYVQWDIEVTGPILTCANCHMRSGLGSYEGGVNTLPTNGAKLYAPLKNGYDLPGTSMGVRPIKAPRPAYTDETLAAALLSGVDPAGRELSETMPRYILEERDMDILIFYLKNLSSTLSPGAAREEGMRLATVVSEGISAEDRKSMLEPLLSFTKRFPRKLILDVWELQGPRDSWPEQLEKQYRSQPVFALLGGLVTGSWQPVHEFCEKNAIPSILPITDLPVISDSDLYTLYFSGGYYQEGETAAKYLANKAELPPGRQIIQVVRDTDAGKALAQGFNTSWKKFSSSAPIEKTLSATEKIGVDFWRNLTADYPDAVYLLWLGADDLAGVDSLGALNEKSSMVFVSSTMIDEKFPVIPDKIRKVTYLTYPYRLPEERKAAQAHADQFWRLRNVHPTNKAISERVFSGISLFSVVFNNLKSNYYRDFFLDLFDMLEDQTGYGVRYPRLSFGPGQRYASKGCYIVGLSEGAQPELIKKSEWVIY